MRTFVATILGNLTIVVASIFFGSLAIVAGQIPPRGERVVPFARAWACCLLWSAGVRLEKSFEEVPDKRQSYVFMANHQSLYDIPALIQALPGQTRFLAKKTLFSIPIFGWALRASGFISIDRKDRSRASESFSEAVDRLRSGASAVVFPEGARSRDGELLPFERGGFLLAIKSGAPIVPVGVQGSLKVRLRDRWTVRPGRITVTYGAPIEVESFGIRGRSELVEVVQQQISRLADLEG